MPPSTVIPQLATIFGAVSGVTRTHTTLPGSLNAVDLPALLFVPREAEYVINAGMTEERRDYAMLLYVAPLAANSFGQAHNDCLPFFSSVRTAWAAAAALNSLANVVFAELSRDSGVTPLIYGQTQYVGIEWTLNVRELFCETVDL